MLSNDTQNEACSLDPANYPPGFLDEALLPAEAGEITHHNKNALAVMRCRGIGPPYVKIGSAVRYIRRDVYAWLKSNRRIPLNTV